MSYGEEVSVINVEA